MKFLTLEIYEFQDDSFVAIEFHSTVSVIYNIGHETMQYAIATLQDGSSRKLNIWEDQPIEIEEDYIAIEGSLVDQGITNDKFGVWRLK